MLNSMGGNGPDGSNVGGNGPGDSNAGGVTVPRVMVLVMVQVVIIQAHYLAWTYQ